MSIPTKLDSILIGLGHKSKQGKGTVAKFLVEDNPQYDIRIYNFAFALKVELFDALMDGDDPYWDTAAKYGLFLKDLTALPQLGSSKFSWIEKHKELFRKNLQCLGTEYRRFQDMYYWVRKVAHQISLEKPQIAVIEDMREWNEACWCRECGGTTVNVQRPGYVNEGAAGHSSEVNLDKWPYDITLVSVNTSPSEEGLVQLRADSNDLLTTIIEMHNPVSAFNPELYFA